MSLASSVLPRDRNGTLAYGVLGLPLAFAALPVYVHVPKLYADGLGLPLAAVGLVLLVSRALDALTDPLIGWASDRVARRRLLILAGLPVLAGGLLALLAPPDDAGLVWLALAMLVATLGYSVSTINYHAWGAEMSPHPGQRTALVASREGFGLAGVVLAASLPALLGGGERSALAQLAWLYVPLLAVCAALTLVLGRPGEALRAASEPILTTLRAAIVHPRLSRLLLVFAANGIAAAIPSVTVLFFVADVLGAETLAGPFLALYFVAAACGLPLWVAAARLFGKTRSWAVSMVLSVLVFSWAASLGEGALPAFAVICVLSGLALGADLTLPPALLSDLLNDTAGAARGGAWFGLWNFVAKANLALAAGLALPLLEWLGYAPGTSSADGTRALALVYGVLPVLLKLIALALLLRWQTLLEGERK